MRAAQRKQEAKNGTAELAAAFTQLKRPTFACIEQVRHSVITASERTAVRARNPSRYTLADVVTITEPR